MKRHVDPITGEIFGVGAERSLVVSGSASEIKEIEDLIRGSRAALGKDPLSMSKLDNDQVGFTTGVVHLPLHRISTMQIGSGTKEPGVSAASIGLTLKHQEVAVIQTIKDELKNNPPF